MEETRLHEMADKSHNGILLSARTRIVNYSGTISRVNRVPMLVWYQPYTLKFNVGSAVRTFCLLEIEELGFLVKIKTPLNRRKNRLQFNCH